MVSSPPFSKAILQDTQQKGTICARSKTDGFGNGFNVACRLTSLHSLHAQPWLNARTYLQAEKNSYRAGSEGQKHLHLHKTNLGIVFLCSICVHIRFRCSLSVLRHLSLCKEQALDSKLGRRNAHLEPPQFQQLDQEPNNEGVEICQ